MAKTVLLYIMSVGYILAGINHFVMTGFYMKIMPPFIPAPLAMVYISGVAECLLGVLLLFPTYRAYAAWGIILLLIAVSPANIYSAYTGGATTHTPAILTYIRLPFQLLFIAWAYWYTY